MQIRLDQNTQLEQLLELKDREREIIELALSFYNSKPQLEISFDLEVLRQALAVNSRSNRFLGEGSNPGGIDSAEEKETFKESVVILSPHEMAQLDEQEKCGLLIGESIFVSAKVPKNYLPLVVLNLSILRRSGLSKIKLEEVFGVELDQAMGAHWTASLIDVAAADSYFGDDKKALAEYLTWRKGVERTEFFENPAIAESYNKKLAQLSYRQNIHPLKRHWRCARSWQGARSFTGQGESGLEAMDALSVSRCDRIICTLRDLDNFDPIAMINLIHFLIPKANSGSTIEVPSELSMDQHAYMLTEDIIGENALLIQSRHPHNSYAFASHAKTTLKAIRDKLAFFTVSTTKKLSPSMNANSLISVFQNSVAVVAANQFLNQVNSIKPSELTSDQAGLLIEKAKLIRDSLAELAINSALCRSNFTDIIKTNLGIEQKSLLPYAIPDSIAVKDLQKLIEDTIDFLQPLTQTGIQIETVMSQPI